MLRPPPTPSLPVHPHQLEVQEFDSYALIVDLRTSAEFIEDHLPGAVSVPGAVQAIPTVTGSADGAMDRSAQPLRAEESSAAWSYPLQVLLARLAPGDAVLLYGGQDERPVFEVADYIQQRGYETDRLPGGWTAYRRWAKAGIDILSRVLDLRWVRCAPGGVGQAVLATLDAQGAQVVLLAAMLGQRRLPGLSLPSDPVLSEGAFETLLLDALRRVDPGRAVWIDEVLTLGVGIPLPIPLLDALRRCPSLQLDVPLADRAARLQAQIDEEAGGEGGREGGPVRALIDALDGVLPDRLQPAVNAARALASEGQLTESLATLLSGCIDQLYEDLAMVQVRGKATTLALPALSPEAIWASLQVLPAPWPASLLPDADQSSP